jgi:hypothetical protein
MYDQIKLITEDLFFYSILPPDQEMGAADIVLGTIRSYNSENALNWISVVELTSKRSPNTPS